MIEWLCRSLFSFQAVLIVGLATVTVFTVSNRFNDPDLWWHLKLGQIVATTRSIPATDLFSFTVQGHPWTAHEWLAQLAIYWAYAAGGFQGLMLWLCLLASLLLVSVYALCWMHTHDPLVSFLGAMMAWFFATVGMAIRPLILGHLFLALELLILEAARTRDRRWLWCLPPLFAVWANCHGSYFFGMGVLAVYWVCSYVNGQWGLLVSFDNWDRKGRNTLGVMLVLCALALCCNPVGIHLLVYPLNTLFQQSTGMNAVDEWLPPDLRSPRAAGMLCTVGGLLLFSLLRRSEMRLRELLLVLMAFALALRHVRMMFLFGIVVSPVVCRLAASVMGRDRRREHALANAVLVFAGLAAVIWAFPGRAELQDQVRKKSPAGAVDYVRQQRLSGPMLNEYEFGGYLIWALPEHKVFIDGRADVYDWAGVFAEYGRWATLVDDPNVMPDKYHIRFCLLRKGAPMARVLPYLPGWRKTYSDDVAEVFVR